VSNPTTTGTDNGVENLQNKAVTASTVDNTPVGSTTPSSVNANAGNVLNSIGRNRLINPAIAVDQRNGGNSQTITAGAALAYTVDRWYAWSTGANVTGQQVAGTAPWQYAYQITGAAGVTAVGFAQRIEALNIADLASSTVTLSAYISSSTLASLTWTAYYANSSNTFGTLAAPTKTQIATGSFTISTTLTRYSVNIALPASAANGVEIDFTTGGFTSGTLTLTGAQLEAGTVATPFERRLYGMELSLAQRYWQKLGGAAAFDIQFTAYAAASSSLAGTFSFAAMRVAPTGSVVGTWNVLNCGQPSVSGVSTSTIALNCSSSAAAATQFGTAGTTTYLTLNAEL
jgi:hypothetical protein